MTGRVLSDRYEIGQALGAGAMGAVFEAFDRQLERKVAVKLLPSGHHSAAVRVRFVREAKMLARVHDPHVVAVHDVGQSVEGDPYIVMELLAGETLREVVERAGRVAAPDAARMAKDVASGLSSIHAAGLVHRDVKPANAMIAKIGEREVVKLLDLGVARATDEATLSKPGAIIGTVLYIAPEQIRGGDVDARADLYALGAVLFELVEGRPPFFAPTPVETIHAHLYDPIPKCSKEVPRPLAEVIAKCLAKRREDRFADAKALAAALDRALGELVDAAAGASSAALPELPPLEGEQERRAAPAATRPSGLVADALTPTAELQPVEGASELQPVELAPELQPVELAPELQPVELAPESADAAAEPLDIAIDSGGHARAAPALPSEREAVDLGEAAGPGLEIDLGVPALVAAPAPAATARPMDAPPRMVPEDFADPWVAPPPRALARRGPVEVVPAPSAWEGMFTVLPSALHLRAALVAMVAGTVAVVLFGSVLFAFLCGLVTLFCVVGYVVSKKHEESL